MVVSVGLAAAVQDLAGRVPDRVDPARLAEHLQVPVHGRQADLLTPVAQFGVDLLGAAEPGEAIKHGGNRLGLPGAPDPGAVRSPGAWGSRPPRPASPPVARSGILTSRTVAAA